MDEMVKELAAPRKIVLSSIIALATVIMSVAGALWALSWNSALDVVQSLQSNRLSTCSLTVEWIEFEIGGGWPFTEAEYDALPRRTLATPEPTTEILNGLKTTFKAGRRFHNHPRDLQTGILKIQRSPSEWFFLYFRVMKDDRREFVEILALPQCSTNPNSGRVYESDSFQSVLQRSDPYPLAGTAARLHLD